MTAILNLREALDEIERLRAAIVMAGRICAEAAGMQCDCDDYYTCNDCPGRIAECADEARELLVDALTSDGPNWATA